MLVLCVVCVCLCVVFFYQAEDGIRYLVRSRGLGDVYKRQLYRNGEEKGVTTFFLFRDNGYTTTQGKIC